MEIATVRGERRDPGNRNANRRLRKAGLIPAVVYGHGETPETLALSQHDVQLALDHMQHVIKFVTDGEEHQYLIKDVQYDHLQATPVHIDLMRVDQNERVQVKVPLELRGEPKGTHEGGVLVHVLTDLEIECLLLKIPETIHANVANLELGQSLQVKDVTLPPDVTPVHKPDDIIAVVRAKRGVHVEEEEEAPVEEDTGAKEPEVIGRTAKEDEAGESGG